MKKWDKRFMEMAKLVASWSKDPSTKCGAVIVDPQHRVVSVGFNGFPAGISDAEELYTDRETKYKRVIHAEKNAILFARRDIVGCSIYVWPIPPCTQCAVAIIQTGISRVVAIKPNEELTQRWNIQETYQILEEAGNLLELFTEEELHG